MLEEMVALGQAEQAQHLLGGGVRALALLRVDGKLFDACACHEVQVISLQFLTVAGARNDAGVVA